MLSPTIHDSRFSILVFCLSALALAPAYCSDTGHLPGDTITNQKGYTLQPSVLNNILATEKRLAPKCTKPRVTQTTIEGEVVRLNGGRTMRWTERWTIDRCGTSVFYVIHFSFFRAMGNFTIEPPKA